MGETAKGTEPVIRQIVVDRCGLTEEEFDRKIYIVRQIAENEVKRHVKRNSEYFYICSLSNKTIIYKGLLIQQSTENISYLMGSCYGKI